MKLNTLLATSVVMLTAPIASAALSIASSNQAGFDSTTAAIVDNTGVAIAAGTGSISVGTFGGLTDAQIQALGSSANISSSFDAVGSDSFGSADGLFQNNISNSGDTSRFVGQDIFTVIGNGDTIADSTQFLIYRHSELNGTGQFVELPGQNQQAQVSEGQFSSGELVIGVFDRFQYDFGAGGAFSAYSLETVPEPSSSALLAIAGVGFILRRRR